ncbi:MAG: glycosyltransferase family 2 protein [Bacteroidetes bacterium]|nr:glycosyltransferase family 2 protein [Bacteroidota bacterium]MCL1969324.1 glycosyltransferase family 2 protein [Bacteroidota bacterium]MCL1969537.1 glycosyltransferase family 2 protein [Bacteroidota bacterium]
MNISLIIPLLNEEESLPELATWIQKVMNAHNFSYEVLFIDDGSRDKSWQVIEQLHKENPCFKGVKFRRNYGKSAALNTGFQKAQGEVIITMDADLQDSPDEIPELYKMITEDGYDLVSGWKKVRYDSTFAKNIPSKFFNWTTRRISKIGLHDFNCGLKAYRKDVIKSIEVYGEMHRYIPVIAKWAGFTKIGEKVVTHQKRKYGITKFGWNRFVNGFLDLLSITFISRFGKKPMHFFGVWGTLAFLIGFGITIALIIQKLILMANQAVHFRQVTDQPLFYLAILAMIIGTQMFLAGFLGEMMSRNASDRNQYIIETDLIQ